MFLHQWVLSLAVLLIQDVTVRPSGRRWEDSPSFIRLVPLQWSDGGNDYNMNMVGTWVVACARTRIAFTDLAPLTSRTKTRARACVRGISFLLVIKIGMVGHTVNWAM